MLSWFRAQIRNHGLLTALRLLAFVLQNRLTVALSNKLMPAKLECPCCGWKGRRFFDYIEAGYRVPNVACPQCDSHSRHRALYLWLKNQYQIGTKRGRALIFAPERALASTWDEAPQLQTIRTDIEPLRGVDLLADVMQLPFLEESVSLIWCHHLLEQVADDRAGMRELNRVLSPTGELLISAGISDSETTQELGGADKTMSGNWRLYGADFTQRLEESGFEVTPMSYDLSEAELKRYAIYRENFFCCRKRNQ